MSDAAGTAALAGDITFDDEAPDPVPNTTTTPGTYRPTDYGTADNLLPPAPQRPYGMLYFVIVGQTASSEGSYGRSSSGAERPQSSGLGACDQPQDLGGSCP